MIRHHVEPGELESDCGVLAARLSAAAGEQTADWGDVNCAACLDYRDDDYPTTDAGPRELRLGEAA